MKKNKKIDDYHRTLFLSINLVTILIIFFSFQETLYGILTSFIYLFLIILDSFIKPKKKETSNLALLNETFELLEIDYKAETNLVITTFDYENPSDFGFSNLLCRYQEVSLKKGKRNSRALAIIGSHLYLEKKGRENEREEMKTRETKEDYFFSLFSLLLSIMFLTTHFVVYLKGFEAYFQVILLLLLPITKLILKLFKGKEKKDHSQSRYKFFRAYLEYYALYESGVEALKQLNESLLPSPLKEKIVALTDNSKAVLKASDYHDLFLEPTIAEAAFLSFIHQTSVLRYSENQLESGRILLHDSFKKAEVPFDKIPLFLAVASTAFMTLIYLILRSI